MRHGRRRTTALVTMLAALLTILVAVPASADRGMTQIGGTAVFGDQTCDGEDGLPGYDFVLDLSGDLDGCWYIVVEDARTTPSGVLIERGAERFVGCLSGDTCGTFDTTYHFSGKFADPDFTEEIFGRCQHPITAGTGTADFAGVEGRVDFKDDVETGTFDYRGHIRL